MKLIKVNTVLSGGGGKGIEAKKAVTKERLIEHVIDFASLFPYKILDDFSESKNIRIHAVAIRARNRKCLVHGRHEEYGAELIDTDNWDRTKIDMDVIANVMSKILYSESRGFAPIVKIPKDSKSFLLDTMFYPIDSNRSIVRTLPKASSEYEKPGQWILYNRKAIRKWTRYFGKWLHFNKITMNYISDEMNTLDIQNRQVLGVLCRGTDYVKLKPKGHAVQPEVEDVIDLCNKVMTENQYSYIYLATEEKRIYDKFCEAFPNKIIINKRRWYDEAFKMNETKFIADIALEDDLDGSQSRLEYFSSLYILSHCKSLIAGCCGGSVGTVMMNNMRYEKLYIYDLGVY